MTADEIRKISLVPSNCPDIAASVQGLEFFLREIAAQLAQLNLNLSVGNSLRGGGGFPDGY